MYTNAQNKLIYIGDPMCSWCYGVAPELEKIEATYSEQMDFELLMGGLRPYNTQTMSELKDFLSHHWEDVHKASNQPFKYDILQDSTITYDTEPPCRAVVVVRQLAPEKTFEFFRAVQEAFYLHNKNLHLLESYHPILKELEIDTEAFDKAFQSEEMKQAVREDFEKSTEMGVMGFPTLVLRVNGRLKLITNGYASAEQMMEQIEKYLKE